jgi:hypothetical protein
MAKLTSSDLLDWTVTDAPPADEPFHPPAPSSSPGHLFTRPSSLSVRLWLIGGSLIAVVVAGLWVFSAYNTWRTRRDVLRIATLEEKAAWAGDTRQTLQFTDDGNADWIKTQAWLAENRQSAPAPLPGLQLSTRKTTLQKVETLTPDIVRVDAMRTFRADDGATFTFTLPQFYRYTRGAWRRIPPPDIFWGELQNHRSTHLTLLYYTPDAGFVKDDLGPYLDDKVARACEAWACPEGLAVSLNLATRPQQPTDPLMSSLFGPHLFLPSPHAQGYPADDAAAAQLKAAFALRVLFAVGDQVVRADGGLDQTGNALFHALIMRTAARLGIVTPQMDSAPTASTLYVYSPAQLWCAYCGTATALEQKRVTTWEADALLSELLRGQPAEVEAALFRSLRSATGPAAWLAAGLSVSSQEAQARLDAALRSIQLATRSCLGCRPTPVIIPLPSFGIWVRGFSR